MEYQERKRQKWIQRYGEENVMPLFPESGIISGFKHPMLPAQLKDGSLTSVYWGLIPHWEKNIAIKYNTLNARIEEMDVKPAFRQYTQNRCIVLADGFMEYHWTDLTNPKCKKLKYLLHREDDDIMGFAAIYSIWNDPESEAQLRTATLVMTEANKLMGRIHNSALRMPVVLNPDEQTRWLDGENHLNFTDRSNIGLIEQLTQ